MKKDKKESESLQDILASIAGQASKAWEERKSLFSSILDFVMTALKFAIVTRDVRTRFFSYALCLLLLAIAGTLFVTGAGFLIWASYEGLSAGLASPNTARLIIGALSFGVAGTLIAIARKLIA